MNALRNSLLAGAMLLGMVPASFAQTSIPEMASTRLRTLRLGETVTGSLNADDFVREDNTFADAFFYNGRAGERIRVTLRAEAFDAWVVVDEPDGPFREHDDDSAGGTDSMLTVTLPRDGRYVILANSVSRATGPYVLHLERAP